MSHTGLLGYKLFTLQNPALSSNRVFVKTVSLHKNPEDPETHLTCSSWVHLSPHSTTFKLTISPPLHLHGDHAGGHSWLRRCIFKWQQGMKQTRMCQVPRSTEREAIFSITVLRIATSEFYTSINSKCNPYQIGLCYPGSNQSPKQF